MSKLMCPLCNTATAFTPQRIHTTAVLDDGSQDYIHFEKVVVEIKSDDYAIAKCAACDDIFVAKRIDYHEWIAVYPILHKAVPSEIVEPIKGAFEEANLCFSVEAYAATVAMCQVALEAMWRQQGASGLNDLKKKDIISGQLFNQATEIRLWARLAKHEFIEGIISKEDAEQLLGYLSDIFDAVYVQPARLAELSKKREQK